MDDATPEPDNDGQNRYANAFSDSSFMDKVKKHARQAGTVLLERALQMYYSARDPKTPAWARAAMFTALGYFIAPIDAVPDIIPGVGFVDDLGVLTAAIATVAIYITEDHRKKAHEMIVRLFGKA